MSVTKPPLGVMPRVLWEFMCDNYRKDSLLKLCVVMHWLMSQYRTNG